MKATEQAGFELKLLNNINLTNQLLVLNWKISL